MDYALVLRLDEATEAGFQNIIGDIARETGNTYILDAKIPPHITVAAFSAESIDSRIDTLEKNRSEFHAGEVTWAPHTALATQLNQSQILT